jgi:hypothetical protein
MAESTLSLSYDDLMEEVAYFRGYGRKKDTTAGLTSAQETQCLADVKTGERLVYTAHDWSWMRPQTTSVAWATTTGTLTAVALAGDTVAASPSYDSTTGYTAVSRTNATFAFTPELCGKTLSAGSDYTIVEYVSASQVKVIGDASGEGTVAFTITDVYKATTGTAAFETTMEGQALTFDTSSTDYTILSYVDNKNLYLDGDASGESGTDTYTITAYGVYRLPADFGGIYGQMTFATGTGAYEPLTIRSEAQIRRLLQDSDSTRRPHSAAIRPVASSPSLGQRFDLLVYPIPDSDYTLYYRYIKLPDALTQANRYPLGGMAHAETFKAACLAAAEESQRGAKGPKWAAFMERLVQSVDYDSRANTAESLGYMGDASDGMEQVMRPHGRRGNIVTFNDVAYP